MHRNKVSKKTNRRLSRKQKYNRIISDHHYPKCDLVTKPNKPEAKCDCGEKTNAVS